MEYLDAHQDKEGKPFIKWNQDPGKQLNAGMGFAPKMAHYSQPNAGIIINAIIITNSFFLMTLNKGLKVIENLADAKDAIHEIILQVLILNHLIIMLLISNHLIIMILILNREREHKQCSTMLKVNMMTVNLTTPSSCTLRINLRVERNMTCGTLRLIL